MIRRSVIAGQKLAGEIPPLRCSDLDWQPRIGCHVNDIDILAKLARPNCGTNQGIVARSDMGMLQKMAFPEDANEGARKVHGDYVSHDFPTRTSSGICGDP